METMKDNFVTAIDGRIKLKFRMDGTPEGKYFLSHPYALVQDNFNGEMSVIVLIEKDYEPDLKRDNSFFRVPLESILEVELLGDKFNPIKSWKEELKDPLIKYIASVD
jgi:hypothetical protein